MLEQDVLEILGRNVDKQVKTLGRDYVSMRVVRVKFADAIFATLEVAGARRYIVDLERDGKYLVYSCNCQQFEDDFSVCKHVWAAIVMLEKAGHFKLWGPDYPISLLPDTNDPEDVHYRDHDPDRASVIAPGIPDYPDDDDGDNGDNADDGDNGDNDDAYDNADDDGQGSDATDADTDPDQATQEVADAVSVAANELNDEFAGDERNNPAQRLDGPDKNVAAAANVSFAGPPPLSGVRMASPCVRTPSTTPGQESWQKILQQILQTTLDAQSPATGEKSGARWPLGREILYVIDRSRRYSERNMVIRVDYRDQKKNGEWKKPKPLSLPGEVPPTLPDATDQQIMDRLIGARRDTWYFHATGDAQLRFYLNRRELASLLPRIAATGRLYLSTDPEGDLRPAIFSATPWELIVDVTHDAPAGADLTAGRYLVHGAFYRDDQCLDIATPELISEEGFLVAGQELAPFSGPLAWIDALRQMEGFFVPGADIFAFRQFMLSDPAMPRLRLPENLRLEILQPIPRSRLRLESRQEWGNAYIVGELSFDYAGNDISAAEPDTGAAIIMKNCCLRRDAAAEKAAPDQLERAGFHPRRDLRGVEVWTIAQGRLAQARNALLRDGWLVEEDGRLYRSAGAFSMRIASGIDWFELHGDIDFGGVRVKLPRLLAALRRQETRVKLEDGSYGSIPEEWLQKYGLLAGLGAPEGDHVRFKSRQAGLLDALLATRPEVSCDAMFEKVRAGLHDFSGITPVDAPAGFRGELRAYQREGLGWLRFLQKFGMGGCLADDMGLGKTIQVLALLEERRAARATSELARTKIPPSLVVMPKSLIFNWLQEAGRFTPALRVLEHSGNERARQHTAFDDYDVIFTTYGTLRRDIALFKEKAFDYIILDESQAIKNAATESAKAVRLLEGNHRLALSGTPIENHLGELWSLFEFLNPGMLGAAAAFRPGKGSMVKLDDDSRALLARALRPFILRRTKGQVARDLPEKVEQTIFCELEPPQRALYNELRDHYRQTLLHRLSADGLAKSKMHVLEALLRLRQAAIHPGLIDPQRAAEPSAKMDILLPQLREVIAEGHKALIFSQFTTMLELLRRQLDEENIRYEYLDGRTRDRAAPVERFQNDPEAKLFLISLKAGGVGLNLTAAEYVFLLDPWWNPAVEAQAIDRTHRIGQTRSVFACRIIARDTVEEKVLELQASKRDIADAIISQDNSVLGKLRAEDLAILLS